MSRGWLIVFAKAPRAGLVKTRMSPPLSLEQAADLYAAMLHDVLNASLRFASALDLEPVIAYHPPEAANELIGLAPAGFRLHAQQGSDLGERMAHAVDEAAAAGVRRILIRGSDSPGLPFERFAEVMERLDDRDDVVLTPDSGGGYALIGLKKPTPRLFDPPMSTAQVLDQTLDSAAHSGLRASTTRATFDLNRVSDFAHVMSMRPEETSDLCPRTVEFLAVSQFDLVL